MVPPGFVELRRLGDGSEGGAFAAVDAHTGGRVVLKRVEAGRRAEVAHAFSVLRSVASPHLPSPRALVEAEDGASWLVTDWVEGRPLEPGPVDSATAVGEALAIAHALGAIHGAGTHHGDVSPANVVVTPTGGIVLVDLGQLGRLGTGTPGFLAPEVLAGGGGPAADRFALGCLLCWRLAGEPPWRRPEALLEVRSGAAVRRRLAALLPPGVPRSVVQFLERLLMPDPGARPQSPARLVETLGGLARACRAGPSLSRAVVYWLPPRWPYRGVAIDATVDALSGSDRPRVVAIAGPSRAGRGRVVEEVIQALQHREVGARLVDPARLGRLLGRPESDWMEAWIEGRDTRSQIGSVVGFNEPPPWPGSLAETDGGPQDESRIAQGRALALVLGARSAATTLVLPVSTRVGMLLREHARDGARIEVLDVRPWTKAELDAALAGIVEGEADFGRALRTVTGGWPAATVRAVAACAAADLQEPDVATLERIVAEAAKASGRETMDLALARAVLRLHWSPDATAARRLPAYLHDGEAPHRAAVGDARRALGPAVRALALETASDGGPVSLGLALDTERVDLVERAVQAQHDRGGALHGDGTGQALVEWLEQGGAMHVVPTVRAAALRFLLADGQAQRAIDLDRLGPPAPVCALEVARAEQRLGRTEAALTRLASVLEAADGDVRLRALGLRWRLLVDAGRAVQAEDEARRAVLPDRGIPAATALSWAGWAALVQGHHARARACLDRAREAIEDIEDREASGLRARIVQMLGNLAHAQGDLNRAVDAWAEAASCFEDAGEVVGALALRGSLASIAVPRVETERGLRHGRAAVRGLVARGQVQGLPEAVLALVQHLARTHALHEAEPLAALVRTMVGPEPPPPTRARILRIEAEVHAIAARIRGSQSGEGKEAERRFVVAARALGAADLGREALEAWVRAASLARVHGRHAAAAAHLARARDLSRGLEDEASALLVALEAVAQRLVTGGGPFEGMLEELRAGPSSESLVARGEVELACQRARLLLEAARRVLPLEHPTRRGLARRLSEILETIMKQAPPNERMAVVESLATDTGDKESLHVLLQELGEGSRTTSRLAERAETEVPRLERLLRMYRRLAREDRLEPLLEQVVDAVMDLTEAERGAVVVQPASGTRLEVTRELGDGSEGMKFSRSVIERVLRTGEPVLSVDAAADDRFDDSRSISHLNLRSVLAVPLVFRSEVLGAVYVDHRLRRGNFGEHHLTMMEEFAELAALAVAHARALHEVREQATRLQAQGEELQALLERREAEMAGLREVVRHAADERKHYRGIVGGTPAMQRVFKLVDRLADSDVPVVVYGESGTGKELVARAIHEAGLRASGPFVAENCGAIPETLLESVLFGHAKGAFTGAQKSKAGLFEAAHGGTIFLDEVSEMSPAMQTKLLRVLQEGEVRRVGENVARPVDVRVIAASNRDLDALVEQGAFRRDLYYRIHVVRVELPPLRERTEDIPALVESFLQRHAQGRALRPTAATMRALAGYRWPGNVRELENEVQRWVALCEDTVTPDDLSPAIRGAGDQEIDPDDLRIRPRVDRLERDLIARALERTDGNQTRAAELLGLSRFGLQKKLKRLAEAGILL